MELDYDCNGALAFDEIKVLMVVMGEKMDEEEIQVRNQVTLVIITTIVMIVTLTYTLLNRILSFS